MYIDVGTILIYSIGGTSILSCFIGACYYVYRKRQDRQQIIQEYYQL